MSDHPLHDRLLLVRAAAGDVHPDEAAEVERLRASCSACAALADELRAISLATGQLPAPRRTRDFRITAEQAERLRGNAITRLLHGLAVPRLAVLQPIAGAAVAIGLLLMVVGAGIPRAIDVPQQQEQVLRSAESPSAASGGAPAAAPEDPARATDERQEMATFGTVDVTNGPAEGQGEPVDPRSQSTTPPGDSATAEPQPEATQPQTAIGAGSGPTPLPDGADGDVPGARQGEAATDPTGDRMIVLGAGIAAIGGALLALLLASRRTARGRPLG